MRRIMKTGLAVILAAGLSGGVALAEGVKIGYIDLEKSFNDFWRTKEENNKLQEVQKAKKAEADRLVADINKLKEEAEMLSAEAKKTKEAALKEKIAALRDYERDSVQEIRDKLLALRKEILDQITRVVEEKGKKEGYTMIMVSDVLIYKIPGMDVTDDIVKILNKGHEAVAAAPAAAPATAPAKN